MRNVLSAVADEWDAEAWAVAQVRSSPAPALFTHYDGSLIAANAQAESLMEGGRVADDLRALVRDAVKTERSQVVRFTRRTETDSARRFELTLMPLPDRNVLVIGREVTIEANLLQALVASRALFRDLALCATDFAFEVDTAGVFTWVSPGDALGYSAVELHGATAGKVFGAIGEMGLFSSRVPVKAAEVWCDDRSGTPRCVELTVVPVRGDDDTWRGVRGVARDVTALRLHEREAERACRRDELVGAVVTAMRAQIEPRRMMLAAADALLAATQSDRVEIRPTRTGMSVSVGHAVLGVEGGLIAATSYQGRTNGSVSLARNQNDRPYGEDEQHLLDTVVPHLGIAIALAESLCANAAQATCDGLTGLLSRHGFDRKGQARLGAFARAGRSSALLLIDCSTFENSCEAEQHTLARLLSRECDAGDIAARIDDDKFALLIGAPSIEMASHRVERLRESFKGLRKEMRSGVDVTASFGLAFVEAESGEPLNEVLSRAESALEAVRREGPQPPKKVMSC